MAWNKECHAGKDSELGMTVRETHEIGNATKKLHGKIIDGGNLEQGIMEGRTWNRDCPKGMTLNR